MIGAGDGQNVVWFGTVMLEHAVAERGAGARYDVFRGGDGDGVLLDEWLAIYARPYPGAPVVLAYWEGRQDDASITVHVLSEHEDEAAAVDAAVAHLALSAEPLCTPGPRCSCN